MKPSERSGKRAKFLKKETTVKAEVNTRISFNCKRHHQRIISLECYTCKYIMHSCSITMHVATIRIEKCEQEPEIRLGFKTKE